MSMPKRRSDAEQKKLYEQWQQSGLSGMEFCAQNRISSGSLWRWKKKFNAEVINNASNNAVTKNLRAMKFYPIAKIKDRGKDIPQNIAKDEIFADSLLELTLPKGISCKIRLSEKSINTFFSELLR
jgi:hypothetical protein